jgi:hypothetical protein
LALKLSRSRSSAAKLRWHYCTHVIRLV